MTEQTDGRALANIAPRRYIAPRRRRPTVTVVGLQPMHVLSQGPLLIGTAIGRAPG